MTESTVLDPDQADLKLLKKKEPKFEVRAYKKRWIILAIFVYYSGINAFQWIEYSSITHLAVKYYQVSTLTVDWTSIVYMALYAPLFVPSSYVIDKWGLRTAGVIGCTGTLIGTSIKVFSIDRKLFAVVLLGQVIVAASQTVIICIPPKIAATWFKHSELSTTCSLGTMGSQLGCAIGFVLPPIIVQDSEDPAVLGHGFKILCWSLTVAMVPVTAAVIWYFPDQPPLPPSIAQAQLRVNKDKTEFKSSDFFQSIKQLFLNKGFLIHMCAYGINIGVFSAIGTLLSQFILQYFEGAHEDAGRMGFVMVITGMIGMVLFGILLDKTHWYKEVTLFIYLFSSVSIICLMYSLEGRSKILTYISCAIVGIFTNAYMPVGFELAIELTFPSEESTTTSMLLMMTQILGVIFTVALGYLNLVLGCFWSLCSQSVLLFIGTAVTAFIPNDLRRQEAFKRDPEMKKNSMHGSRLVFIE
nr:unnamed protein product [Callosobruchus analis]